MSDAADGKSGKRASGSEAIVGGEDRSEIVEALMTTSEHPQNKPGIRPVLPSALAAAGQKPDDLIVQIENFLECWKQIACYLGPASARTFEPQDESQFLELKAVIAQELEVVLASPQCRAPARDDVHAMINSAPSLRHLSLLSDGALRKLENDWHVIYIGWQATLGQVKARQRAAQSHSRRAGLWEHPPERKNESADHTGWLTRAVGVARNWSSRK